MAGVPGVVLGARRVYLAGLFLLITGRAIAALGAVRTLGIIFARKMPERVRA